VSRVLRATAAAVSFGLLAFTIGEGAAARLGHTGIAESSAAGWSTCALSVGATIASGVAAQPAVIAAATSAGCQCVPEWVDEFDGMTCP
jgi:hypothetical protein